MAFLCLLCACLPSFATYEWSDQQHFTKTKMGYISLPSVLNARVGITSYYCVILKIVILHDGKTTIQNAVFRFSLKKERNIVSFQKTKKTLFIFKQKNRWLFFLKKKTKTGCSQPYLLWPWIWVNDCRNTIPSASGRDGIFAKSPRRDTSRQSAQLWTS